MSRMHKKIDGGNTPVNFEKANNKIENNNIEKEYHGFLSVCDNIIKEIIYASSNIIIDFFKKAGKKIKLNEIIKTNKFIDMVIVHSKKQYEQIKDHYNTLKSKFSYSNDDFMKNVTKSLLISATSFIIVSTAATSLDHKVALIVKYDNEVIGVVESQETLNKAIANIQNQIVHKSNLMANIPVQADNLTITNSKNVISSEELEEKILSLSNDTIKQGYGLYIDNKFYGATIDKKSITLGFESVTDKYTNAIDKNNIVDIKIKEKIEIKEGLFTSHDIIASDTMQNNLSKNLSDQSPSSYFTKSVNLSNKTNLYSDSDYPTEKNLVNILISVKEKREEDIPFSTQENIDNEYLTGYEKVLVEGENGKKEIVESVEYLNGVELSRKVSSTQNTTDPVNRVILKGNKIPTPSSNIRTDIKGGFIWPLSGGYISDNYGSRGGTHLALDIAAPYGTSIYAAGSGTVVSAGWYGGYGNYVLIDHGNGIQTAYGHSSAILVSPGQKVTQGTPIARVGSTGNSTGNHLHFEVNVNGRNVDPLLYVSK